MASLLSLKSPLIIVIFLETLLINKKDKSDGDKSASTFVHMYYFFN